MNKKSKSTEKKIDEFYQLIDGIEVAMMTTCRHDGTLVTRPMATQDRGPDGDLWFVTNIETDKCDEIDDNRNISLGYYNPSTKEWVSVSGTATISKDRQRIRELHQPDWNVWFENEGGKRDGGPDDPRLALIFVDAHSVHYMKSKYSKPRVLFEIAKAMITGDEPDIGREEQLSARDLD